jgi:hypothetical protein
MMMVLPGEVTEQYLFALVLIIKMMNTGFRAG